MEAAKGLLERFTKIIISVATIVGTMSSVLLMSLHIKMLPINIAYYPQEITLSLCMSIVYLISDKFDVKYFKSIAAVALIISIFNLVGFRILIKIFAI
jgi:multidrug transporter EmrE-like cation transporter